MASKSFVLAPYSKMRFAIAQILKDEGFIHDVVVMDEVDGKKTLKVMLRYFDGESVIHEIKRVSKPSCRQYKGVDEIKPVIGKLGISIVSTNQGVISHKKAKELGVGGEVICTVW
jgi:small subunit ribosomal protein S8